MALVFPIERASRATRDAFGLGLFWFATVLFAGAFVGELMMSLATPNHPLWLALPSLMLIWIGALVLRSVPLLRLPLAFLVLAVMLSGVFWFTDTISSYSMIGDNSGSFFLTSVKIGVLMVCTMSDRWTSGAVGAAIGYLLAEAVVILGVLDSPRTVIIDVPAIIVTVGLMVGLELIASSGRRALRVEGPLQTAAFEGLTSRERAHLQLRSTALVHDTILNELATLATSRPGPIPAAVLAQIATSLHLVSTTETLPSRVVSVPVTGSMLAVIDRMRAQGLAVAVSGDLLGMDSLPPTIADALEQALEQCLVNVLRHSGSTDAELIVFVGADEVTVMVTDNGVGFDEKDVPGDRMGLRHSVRGRILSVGGAVHLWSSPGDGTSIVLSVPRIESV